MPATYTLIASNTLSSAAASVTFSSIPATYTDLVLRISGRSDSTSASWGTSYSAFYVDATSGSGNSPYILSYGTGTTTDNDKNPGNVKWGNYPIAIPRAAATSNTFGSVEIYIPNYASTTQTKPASYSVVTENNGTAAAVGMVAKLYNSTSAITSLTAWDSNNFVSGSSFFLYGIKNS